MNFTALSSRFARWPQWLKLLAVGLAVFFLLTLISSSAGYGLEKKFNRNPVYLAIFLDHTGKWLPWPFLVPCLWVLVDRFPFRKDRWRGPLALHLVISVLWLPVYLFLIIAFEVLRGVFGWATLLAQYKLYFGVNLFGDYQWYWIIMIAVTAVRFSRELIREREETAALLLKNTALQKDLAESHLETLKAQIQPHFLYNTHHAIGALIRRDQPREALEVLTLLSRLLRHSLEGSLQQCSTLGEEMDFIDDYLAIQKIRFPDSLRIHKQIDRECEKARIPTMVLQPLVENAVNHGLASAVEGDTIQIKANVEEKTFIVRVINRTGSESKDVSGFGIGLKNTRSRLHHLFGEDHSLELEYVDESTICATLTLPYRT